MIRRQTPSAFLWLGVVAGMTLTVPAAQALTVDVDGVTVPESNGFLRDGGDDQLDGGTLLVNGSAYTGGASGTLPNFSLAPQAVGGVTVSGRVDLFSFNGTTSANTRAPGLTDYTYARQFYTFANLGNAAVNLPVQFLYNLGSDAGTVVAATSSGDATISAADVWSVTDDAVNGGPAGGVAQQDPAVALLVADGRALSPSAFFVVEPGFVQASFALTLAAGESRSLMLFVASRNETELFTGSASRLQTQADVESLLRRPLQQFNGLTAAQAASVANFVPEPTGLGLLGLGGTVLLRRRR